MLLVCALTLFIGFGAISPAAGVSILSQGANVDIYLGEPFNDLEFENPLAGGETVKGYKIQEWRDADYNAGPPRWYDDWTVSDPCYIDGNVNEIWMRRQGQSIWTAVSPCTTLSVHMVGDNNDGIAEILVDGVQVAKLDMYTAIGASQTALIIVKNLGNVNHTVHINALGVGQGYASDVATMGAAALGDMFKWRQPPVPGEPDNVYYGWNEESVYEGHQIAADDWVCNTEDPVTDIHWWGSYINWKEGREPDDINLPTGFHITIWTDVPAGADEPFSHPGQVIWKNYFDFNQLTRVFVGWDFDPRTKTYEACFLYDLLLEPEQYFYQEPGGSVPNIYWLSIAADYPAGMIAEYPWGWKTRPHDSTSPAPDAAVRIFDPTIPGMGDIYRAGEPIEDLDILWDLAFELTAKRTTTVVKWIQPPDLSDLGLDVDGTKDVSGVFPPQILADDFPCEQTGPITEIVVWCSWWRDLLPEDDPRNVKFTLSLHRDIPVSQSPTGYSMPGEMLWMKDFQPGEFTVEIFADQLREGWYSPCMQPPLYEPVGDTICWIYRFPIDSSEAYVQKEGNIYWLDIQAQPLALDPMVRWGWKSSTDHWNDAAVWVVGEEPYQGDWNELRYPEGHELYRESIDLAFEITTTDEGDMYVKWEQPPEPYIPEDAINGWDEYSVRGTHQIVADDWFCDSELPVSDVHWWGSFLGWPEEEPPQMPDSFHFAIWTDVPVDPDVPDSFSHPGKVIWEHYCKEFSWKFVGWDFDPRNPQTPPEACFKFEQDIPEDMWFYQEPGDNIYWISIAAIYDAGVPNMFPWGWKTRPRDPDSQAPDDAVIIMAPTAPAPGMGYESGRPIFWPTPEDSWDMAFELTTKEPTPPELEYGDAPEGGIAYPSMGVTGQFPTCITVGPAGWIQHGLCWAHFGPGFDFEPDGNAGLCPGCFPLYDQDECFNDGDAGLIMPESYTIQQGPTGALVVVPCQGANGTPLGTVCQAAQWGVNVDIHVVNNMPVDGYVNVLMDWDQDGKWAGGSTCPDGTTTPEHVLVNFVVPVGFVGPLSGLNPPAFTIGPNPGYIWTRFTITEQPVPVANDWNGEGQFEDGETEDYLLKVEETPWVVKPHVPNLKWSQPPIEIDPYLNRVPIYCGWDEPSLYPFDDPQYPDARIWKLVADDFRCLGRMPVTSVHWWGSHVDWIRPEPPEMVPIAWRIGFWSNVPAGGVSDYSYPKVLLHQIEVDASKVEVEWAGYDEFPDRPTDSCFQYYVKLDPCDYFKQGEYDSPDNVFWISITAIYPVDIAYVENPWGWKTRPWHWMDDAVTFTLPEEPLPGMITDPAMIRPLEDDTFGELESYDTAFELDTDPEWVKWDQPFTGFRRWPHYEDEASWATENMLGVIDYKIRVADDWLCMRRTPVTSMVWWGSYLGYRYKACDYQLVPPPRKPDKFELTIWTDVPADDPCNIYDYSHPDKIVWRHVTNNYDEVLVGFDKHPEGEPGPREPVFRYSVRLHEDEWFCQNGVNNVYWLSVVAIYNEPADINYPWGWTNHDKVELKSDLVGYWSFNEGAGVTAFDTGTGGNDASLVGDAAWSYDPMRGNCLDFDGNGDYVKTADVTSGLDFAPNSFSVSAWINGSEVTGDWKAILEYDRGGTNWFGLWLTTDGKIHFRVGDTNTLFSNQVLNPRKWYLLTATFDSSDKSMRVYINGQLDSSGIQSAGFDVANASKLTIGTRNAEDDEYFDGMVDDVRVYTRVLSPKEIKKLLWVDRNDDAVEGITDAANNEWEWWELYDQTGESEDMSFTLFTDPDVCCQCADFISDGMVDFNDLVIFVSNWLWTGSPGGYNTADLNCDGEVQLLDFAIFSSQWLSSCP